MNEEAKVLEDIELGDVIHVCEDLQPMPNGGILGKVILGLGFCGAAIGVAAYKQKDKIANWSNQRRIKKLEKAGYTVVTFSEAETECDADREVETE